jgi:beta-glucosidase
MKTPPRLERNGAVWLGIIGAIALAATPRSARAQADDPAMAVAKKVLSQMTLAEKVTLCHGASTFSIGAIPRVGLPDEFVMDDGPNNVRPDVARDEFTSLDHQNDFSTSLPPLSALAATWDITMATNYGQVLGEEARARGKDMILGPGVNMMRTPLCGRNFEYMGEDPKLTGTLAAAYIRGMQSQDVAACVKHYDANSQELNRFAVDEEIDERTLREIYLPAFEAAVKQGGVLTVMDAYNKVRGQWCSENSYLNNTILKTQWAFPGFVVTDWGALHNTIAAALGGADVEMDAGSRIHFFAQPLLDAVQAGKVPEAVVNDKALRVLYVMARLHKIGGGTRAKGSLNTPEHQQVARQIAENAIVLLKNQAGLLPLHVSAIKRVLVLGQTAINLNCQGGGSAAGKPPYEITPLAGLQKRLGAQVEVDYAPFPTSDTTAGLSATPDHALAGQLPSDRPMTQEQVKTKAQQADVVLLFTGDAHGKGQAQEGEGNDRPNMKLPAGDDEAIAALVGVNPKTVVVNLSGTPVEMPWIDQVSTLVQYWFSGQEGGNALAAVLFGDVNPSGKLPFTFPVKLADTPAAALNNYNAQRVDYAEGIFIGYRWYDAKKIEPLFPFGYGLSYATFAYKNVRLSQPSLLPSGQVQVSVEVTNTGKVAGAETVQLYVHDPKPAVEKAPRELKGFAKVMLQPGETRTVALPLVARDLAYFDPPRMQWKADAGVYELSLGTSSRDLRQQTSVDLSGTYTEPVASPAESH